MQLHRADKVPEWEKIPPEQHNKWQRRAAETHGIDTPGNRASVAGAGLVFDGLRNVRRGRKFTGLMEIGVGRLFDIADGKFAERTGTKGPLGEAVDAGIDKAEVVAAIPVLLTEDLIPVRTAAIVGVQNGANALLTGIAKRRNLQIHPSRLGKLTATAQWTAMGFHGLSRVADAHEKPALAEGLKRVALAGEAASVVLGAAATAGYINDVYLNPVPIEAEPPAETLPPDNLVPIS